MSLNKVPVISIVCLLALGCDQQKQENPVQPIAEEAEQVLAQAKYPIDMPVSPLVDSRLIGYWLGSCNALSSRRETGRWSFLLDRTKAVLEWQIFEDDSCKKAVSTSRTFMTFTADGTRLEGKVWEVHASFLGEIEFEGDTSQTCDTSFMLSHVWYDFTDFRCKIKNMPAITNRGGSLISSAYFMDKSEQFLRFEVMQLGTLQLVLQN